MKHLSISKLLFLSVITFGIYQLFWTKRTRDEMVAKGAEIPSFIVLFLPFFALAALGLLMLMFGSESDTSNEIVNPAAAISLAIGAFVAIIAAIGVSFWWFYKYCYGVELVTQGQLSFGTSYVVFVLLSLFGASIVWPLIIQDGFNKTDEHTPHHRKPHHNPTGPILSSR